MALTYPLIVFFGLSCELWMGADAGFHPADCKSDCCMACPDKWFGFKSRCFQFFYGPKTWSEAEEACKSVGGNLASAHDDEIQMYRQSVKEFVGRPAGTWFGGYQMNEGVWKWSTGDRFGFKSWDKGEPSDTTGKENCVEMMGTAQQSFNDAPCSAKKAFICVRDKMATN